MDIKTTKTEDLKILAYDIMTNLQKLQNDLSIINQEISQRSNIKGSTNEQKNKQK